MVKRQYGCAFRNFVFFSLYLNGLSKLYPELFDDDAGGSSSKHIINFSKKWGSYSSIVELANGEIERIDIVVKQPLEKCLLLLAYKADKSFVESLIHKESLKSMK